MLLTAPTGMEGAKYLNLQKKKKKRQSEIIMLCRSKGSIKKILASIPFAETWSISTELVDGGSPFPVLGSLWCRLDPRL